MIKRDYDRYEILKNNDGSIDNMPFVEIPINNTDKYDEWFEGRSRMDRIANRFYANPFYDFLILYANPQFLTPEDIPDGTVIRIPFPLAKARKDYEDGLKKIRNQ